MPTSSPPFLHTMTDILPTRPQTLGTLILGLSLMTLLFPGALAAPEHLSQGPRERRHETIQERQLSMLLPALGLDGDFGDGFDRSAQLVGKRSNDEENQRNARILFQPAQKRDAALLLDKIMFALKRAMDERVEKAKSAPPSVSGGPRGPGGSGGTGSGGGQAGEAGAYLPGGDMVAYEGVGDARF